MIFKIFLCLYALKNVSAFNRGLGYIEILFGVSPTGSSRPAAINVTRRSRSLFTDRDRERAGVALHSSGECTERNKLPG